LVLWTGVVWLFRQSFWTALLVGVGLTQIGEFSFILVQVARSAGHVGADVYNATLATALVTILINAALVRLAPGWVARARGVGARAPAGSSSGAPRAGWTGGRRRTWCSAASAGSAARWGRRSRRSASGSWRSSEIRTSSAGCGAAG